MSTQIIQVPMSQDLVKKLNKVCKKQKMKRAALVRQACERMLKEMQEEEWDRQYVESYRLIPEDPAIGEVGLLLAAETLEKEDW